MGKSRKKKADRRKALGSKPIKEGKIANENSEISTSTGNESDSSLEVIPETPYSQINSGNDKESPEIISTN